MALPLFAVTLFVSAFMLFLVQPMIGKMILPKLGGTPQVWNTCMMFFQTVLLVGYAYSHTVSTRLSLRKQLIVHCCFLIVPLLFLIPNGPFNITAWVPPTEDNPIPSTLFLLMMVVGVPFLVVSTSAPLLQRWFSYTGDPAAKDPYFLYGASNLGSLLALVAYPFIVEPAFILTTQAWIWLGGYLLLMALVALSAARVWNTPPSVELADISTDADKTAEPAPVPAMVKDTSTAIQPSSAMRGVTRKKGARPAEHAPASAPETSLPRSDAMTWGRRIRWILLAAVPSSLMLGVTSYASVDLSPFPLLWVIPLALYLLSFICVFAKWPLPWTGTPHAVMLFLGPFFILGMCYIILVHAHSPSQVFASFFCFFIVACVCHGELAKDRPTPRHLTEYFLLMSFGGMIGGVFNALVAPLLFAGVVEYPLAIVCACLMRPRATESGWIDGLVLKSSPDLQKWAEDTGDQMSVAFGGQPRRSPYIVNFAFDILIGLVILGVAVWMATNANAGWGWQSNNPNKNSLMKFMKFIGFSTAGIGEWFDVIYRIAFYGLPLILALLVVSRPWRFGIAIAGVLLAHLYFAGSDRNLLYAGRSYFGVLRVLKDDDIANGYVEEKFVEPGADGARIAQFHYLMHGTTYHGRNYFDPPALSRLATTYYHRWGPVGIVMERYNWLKGPQNTFWGDNRMPAGLAGLGAAPLGVGNLPLDQLCHLWSEPPLATIGLGTGTMASYGRPYQHVVYYEIDEKIRNFNLPLNTTKEPFFTYLRGSLKRGSQLEVIMGDARLSMANSAKPDASPRLNSLYKIDDDGIITQIKDDQGRSAYRVPQREKYYKVIVVDAFSSDAIPIHLITKEAIELYMSQLQDDGVLCVHTSNRHMDLTKPVADIAENFELNGKPHKLAYIIGHDPGSDRRRNAKADNLSLGHFGSEYVMLSWSKDSKSADGKLIPGRLNIKNLEKILLDPTQPFNAQTNPVCGMDADKNYGDTRMWFQPSPPGMRLWTDDYSNIISILR